MIFEISQFVLGIHLHMVIQRNCSFITMEALLLLKLPALMHFCHMKLQVEIRVSLVLAEGTEFVLDLVMNLFYMFFNTVWKGKHFGTSSWTGNRCFCFFPCTTHGSF